MIRDGFLEHEQVLYITLQPHTYASEVQARQRLKTAGTQSRELQRLDAHHQEEVLAGICVTFKLGCLCMLKNTSSGQLASQCLLQIQKLKL